MKIKYINDLRNVFHKKSRKQVVSYTRGMYLLNNETIYILKKLPRTEKGVVLFHEMVHWLIDKCSCRMRFQCYWDTLWAYCFGSEKIRKSYRSKYRKLKGECPFEIKGRVYKW